MIQISKNFLKRYNVVLEHNNVPTTQQNYYFKWLRYFLDFCQKYNFPASKQGSLPAFMAKLKEKNQAEHLRKQAHHAVILYQTMKSGEIKNSRDTTPANHVLNHTKTPEPDKSHNRKNIQNQPSCPIKHIPTVESVEPSVGVKAVQYRTDWTEVFNELKNSIQIRHYSPKTLKTYTGWVRRFQTFVASKDPTSVSVEDVKAFLTWLAVKQKVSASSQNQAFNALLFLFRNVFGTEFGQVDGVVRAKRRPYIPVVLSRKEVDRIIGLMTYPHKLIISLMYGCGLRISECLSLRVHNFNFDMKILTIHDGKGKKDRTVPIPDSLMAELKKHLDRVIALHERDCKKGFDGVFLYGQLEKKYKNAAKELIWQWFFPARNLTRVEKSNEQRRYHIHETSLQKALRKAVIQAKIPKRVTSHTFRHSFASHLLQANYDIRTIQQLLGHSDVRTTMIYTHTVKSVTVKELKSPLDF